MLGSNDRHGRPGKQLKVTLFCKCRDTHFLLHAVFPDHHTKDPCAVHQVTPIAVLSLNPEEYQRKHEAATKAAAV